MPTQPRPLRRTRAETNRPSRSDAPRRGSPLAAALLLVTALILPLAAAPTASAVDSAGDEYDAMRLGLVADLTGTIPGSASVGGLAAAKGRLVAEAEGYWSTLETDGGEPWPDLVTGTSAVEVWAAYKRVTVLATALKTPGTALTGDPALLRDVVTTADWLSANRYNRSTTGTSRWWEQQIGIPLELNSITALLYPDLSAAQVQAYLSASTRFADTVTRTGANRVWTAAVIAGRAVLLKQPAKIAEAAAGIDPALRTVASGDGFHADGSFVQHSVFAYSGGYGLSMLDTLDDLYALLDGSRWEITSPEGLGVYDRLASSFAPVTWCGAVMSTVRGRETARAESEDGDVGVQLQAAVLRLADSAPPAARTRTNALAKSWLACNAGSPVSIETAGSVSDVVRARLVLADTGLTATPIGSGVRAFAGMDRFTRTTATSGFAVGLSSTRIARYESLNGENRSGWYTGDGATSLHLGSGRQYDDGYWATANPYRMPGTTEDTIVRSAGEGASSRPTTTFTGSLESPSRRTGIAALDFDAASVSLVAKKAWFTFDDEILALGSGITATDMSGTGWDGVRRRAETVIDDRRDVAPDARLRVDGVLRGAEATATSTARWASITGSAESVGYVFPTPIALTAQGRTRTGAWSAVSAAGPTAPVTGHYYSLTTSHGTNPTGASYAYTVLPGASEAATAAYAADPDVTVLSNTPQLSAARDRSTGTVSAVSWKAGTTSPVLVGGTRVASITGAGLVSIREDADTVTVSTVDPTQVSTSALTVTLARPTAGTVSSSAALSVTSRTSTATTITFRPNGLKGATASIVLAKRAATPVPTAAPTPTATAAPTSTSTPTATATPLAAVGAGTHQNGSPAVAVTGTWSTTSSSADSGGGVSFSSTGGASATLRFTGTGVSWVSRRSSTSGIDEVRLDGVLVASVDRYSATTRSAQTVWTSGTLPAGTHTVTITRGSTRNPAATGGNLIHDAFVVRG